MPRSRWAARRTCCAEAAGGPSSRRASSRDCGSTQPRWLASPACRGPPSSPVSSHRRCSTSPGLSGLAPPSGVPFWPSSNAGQHQILLAVLAVAVAIALVLLIRIGTRRALLSLESGGWTGPLHLRLDSLGILVMPLCLGINFAGHALAVGLKLPLFLDSTGTILCGVLAGPWVGGSIGVLSNLLVSNTFQPAAASYAIVSFAVGFTAGLSRYLNWQRRASGWILLWVVCVGVSALLSTPINLLVSNGQSGVGFGDSIYGSLSTRLPHAVAAFVGELAVDLPDKLVAVAGALWIAQALARQSPAAEGVDLDLGEPFTFVFRSPRWGRRVLVGALCYAFFWLVVPGLLLLGYLVELSRRVRDGQPEVPRWDHRWRKIKDGFAVTSLFVLWSLPGIVVSVIGGILLDPSIELRLGSLGDVLSALGNVWQVMVLVLQMPVWAQYLQGGFRAALDVRAIVHRLRVNPSLTVVVAALTLILLVIGVLGLIALVIGVLVSLTYMSFVWAHLAGIYARLTDPAPRQAKAA